MRNRFLLAAAMASVCPASATAQAGGNIDLQAFRPAMDSRGYITQNASQVLGHGQLSFGLVTNWGRGVLRFDSPDGATYEVTNVLSPTLVGAAGLWLGGLHLELGASLPFVIVAGDRGPDDDGGTPSDPNDDDSFRFDGQGLGDVALHAKLRLATTSRRPHLGVAVVASLYLPTASPRDAWLGEGGATPQLVLVVDREWGRTKAAVNAGVRWRTGDHAFVDDTMTEPMTGARLEAGPSLPFGLALGYALAPGRVELVGELYGDAPLRGENFFPLEAVGGLKVYLARSSFFTLGGGLGLVDRGGSADARAFLGIVFEPSVGDLDGDGLKDDVDACPDNPEDYDDFEDADGCPELDNDLDGIVDTDDGCPNTPEDKDGIDDHDGCPDDDDLDRDGDRILDDVDACPDDPEDYDEFEDADGCPDPDNDRDGILDIDDLCPNEPEDYDDWDDTDGCPDPDNDRDRILDVDDACPNEPENYNNYLDDDGCPDRDVVIDTGGTLEILEKIHFEYDKAIIKPESFPILDAVGATLRDNPDILLVEIQGHTDERGGAAYNLDLSQRRAEAVVAYLTAYGIDAARLAPQGYGESDPKDRRHNEEAWATNRRVEFLIIKREGGR